MMRKKKPNMHRATTTLLRKGESAAWVTILGRGRMDALKPVSLRRGLLQSYPIPTDLNLKLTRTPSLLLPADESGVRCLWNRIPGPVLNRSIAGETRVFILFRKST